MIFKIINKYGINTLQVIISNYITACILGLYLSRLPFNTTVIISSDWFYGAVFLGILFIAVFNVMAITAQQNGISVASVATKMSVIVPIVFGIFMYNEGYGPIKLSGIALALLAVYLASIKSEKLVISAKTLWLPIIVFVGSGIIDTSIKYIQIRYLDPSYFSLFSSVIFFFAGITGLSILLVQIVLYKNKVDLRSIPAGMILGVVNYGSIYYLLSALSIENFESSTIFTVNNVCIVILSTLVGLFVFKEKLYPKNWLGVFLAVIAIILVSVSF